MEALRLKTSGFSSVRILFGGMNAWYSAGGRIEGGNTADIFSVAPSAVCAPDAAETWDVISVTVNEEDVSSYFPDAEWYGPCTNRATVSRAVQRLSEKLETYTSPVRIAVIGGASEPVISLLSRITIPPQCSVFYVAGGVPAVQNYAVLARALRRKSKPGYISPRLKVQRTPCSSCP